MGNSLAEGVKCLLTAFIWGVGFIVACNFMKVLFHIGING